MRAAIITVLVVGCAGSPVPDVRFANAPIVEAMDDRRDVPVKPQARDPGLFVHQFDGSFYRPVLRVLELPRAQRAQGVNALDEVPDSTWFTNRIGAREITPDEIRAASGGVGTPEHHFPWTIESTKIGGLSIGFIIRDARGEKFLLKFDPVDFPEAETAAQMITGRLLWACGYNVTDDYLVHFRREDLILAPGAFAKEPYGLGHGPLDGDELARKLALVAIGTDGRYRGVASAWIEGVALGGHPSEGVRADDPNDRIPHELRRDLRGAYPIFAWLDHEDAKEANTFDTWIEDPRDRNRHYVTHLIIDFGKSLGFHAMSAGDPRIGHEHRFDWDAMFESFVTLGTQRRPWEGRPVAGLRGVGIFENQTFDPGGWKPHTQAYYPLKTADRFDKFWGAKILMRFTPDQIRAAVDAAELTDPRAADYLVDTLVARQHATGRYWFARVNPLDGFAVSSADELCFDDLAIGYGFTPAAATTYTVTRFDRRGRDVGGAFATRADPSGGTCMGPVTLAEGRQGYTIVRVTTSRPGFTGSTDVHLARDPASGAPRIIGIWRS
jgi:hypothetical protein